MWWNQEILVQRRDESSVPTRHKIESITCTGRPTSGTIPSRKCKKNTLQHGTYMQKSACCVRHHDGGECPKFKSTLENICEKKREQQLAWVSHSHPTHNTNLNQLLPLSNHCYQFNSQVCRKRDIGRFHDVTTSTVDRGNSILSGLDTVMSLESRR